MRFGRGLDSVNANNNNKAGRVDPMSTLKVRCAPSAVKRPCIMYHQRKAAVAIEITRANPHQPLDLEQELSLKPSDRCDNASGTVRASCVMSTLATYRMIVFTSPALQI